MALDGQKLLEYALKKFQEEKYDEALDAFVLAYSKGYEREWILENIYNCYMEGNDESFCNAYEHLALDTEISYKDCTLDFIPYQEGEYYIFDKEIKKFRGIFSTYNLRNIELNDALKESEFSSPVVLMDWNWEEVLSVLAAAKERKVYVVCHDMYRAVSFFKILELEEYWRNVKLFPDGQSFQEYFHCNTGKYLPHVVFGDEEGAKILSDIIMQEHQYRLTSEGRNNSNILLTIGIPTHDRGNLLLKRLENLQKMLYDAEIEIAVSKHGTHYYQEEYKSVEKIKDARINYVGYDKELSMTENWRNVIKIAHGKFVMLVSDEDDVILDALEYYLAYLNKHPKVGAVRSRTIEQYRILSESKYYLKGEDAFLGGFLHQNYLSGIIYNKEIFESADLEAWDQKYKDNAFYYLYPHMWWHAALSFLGDYATDNQYLIAEGASVWKEETSKYKQDGVEEDHGATEERPDIIDIVSSFKARLDQFKGAVLLINDYDRLNMDLKVRAYQILIDKTLSLMIMVRDLYPEEEFFTLVEKLVDEVIISVSSLQVGREREEIILKYMETWLKYLEYISV